VLTSLLWWAQEGDGEGKAAWREGAPREGPGSGGAGGGGGLGGGKDEVSSAPSTSGVPTHSDRFRLVGDKVEGYDYIALHGRIEELDLGPGQEREVVVCYNPSTYLKGSGSVPDTHALAAPSAGTLFDKGLASLQPRTFRVFLKVMNQPHESQAGSQSGEGQDARMDTPADRLAQHAFRAFRKVLLGKAKVCILCGCVCAYMYACVCVSVHIVRGCIYMHISTYMHACIHTYIHTYIHACMRTYIHA